jgi:hypothetical protein
MLKRRPTYKPHQSKISVEDVSDYTTPQGAAMANEEMRRLALEIEAAKKAAAPIAAEEKAVPVIPVKEAPKAEPPVVTTNNIENPITITSDDDSVVIRKTGDNHDLDVWDYEERLETTFISNPNGFDWLADVEFPQSIDGESYSIVLIGSTYYNCLVTHRSSSSFAADLALGYWAAIPDWIQGGGYGCKVVDLYNVATDPVPSDIGKQVKVNGGEVGLLKAYLIDQNGPNTGRWWVLTADPIVFDDLLTITGGSGSGMCAAVSTVLERSLVEGPDGLVYYARVQHEADALNAPPNYEYWVVPFYNNVGYRELVNRDLPIYNSNFQGQIDLRYINGDGWMPFLYGANINRILKCTESVAGFDAALGWFKKASAVRYEHPYSLCTPSAREKNMFYFKPRRAGSYRVNCSVDLKLKFDIADPAANHLKCVKAMMLLHKWQSTAVQWTGNDFPVDYMTPIAHRVDIAAPDGRNDEMIYSILDRKTITEIAHLVHNNTDTPPPVWEVGMVYVINYVVDVGGIYYKCMLGHTSNYLNLPPFPTHWVVYDYATSPWVSGVGYVIGNKVTNGNNIIYECRENHTSSYANEPPNPRYWTVWGYTNGLDIHYRNYVTELQLSGHKIIYTDAETYCFVPYYKLYFVLVNIDVIDDVNHNIQLHDFMRTERNTVKYCEVYEAKHTIDVEYLGSDLIEDADPYAYKIARLF